LQASAGKEAAFSIRAVVVLLDAAAAERRVNGAAKF